MSGVIPARSLMLFGPASTALSTTNPTMKVHTATGPASVESARPRRGTHTIKARAAAAPATAPHHAVTSMRAIAEVASRAFGVESRYSA